jgi:hypothetical protein
VRCHVQVAKELVSHVLTVGWEGRVRCASGLPDGAALVGVVWEDPFVRLTFDVQDGIDAEGVLTPMFIEIP